MDRNVPGVARIKAMLTTGSHVLIRVKSDIRLPRISPFAEDGSYWARLSGGGATLTMRVVEYHVDSDGATIPELFCLVTDRHCCFVRSGKSLDSFGGLFDQMARVSSVKAAITRSVVGSSMPSS
jgi:hypothetical protein